MHQKKKCPGAQPYTYIVIRYGQSRLSQTRTEIAWVRLGLGNGVDPPCFVEQGLCTCTYILRIISHSVVICVADLLETFYFHMKYNDPILFIILSYYISFFCILVWKGVYFSDFWGKFEWDKFFFFSIAVRFKSLRFY